MMNRRRAAVLAMGVLLPAPAFAQHGLVRKRLGVLIAQGPREDGQWRIDMIQEGLKRHGWTVGDNIEIDFRWAEGNESLLQTYAVDLVARRPDVLWASNSAAARALKGATNSIPIVFVNVTDPVANGFSSTLSAPDRNVTGFTDMDPAIAGKWVTILKELAPDLKRIRMVYNPDISPWAKAYLPSFEETSRRASIDAGYSYVKTKDDYVPAIEECGRGPKCAIIVIDDALFAQNVKLVVSIAAEHRVPAMYTNRGYVVAFGGLVAYGISLLELYAASGAYVDRLLKGATPNELPIQAPTKFVFALNLRTASAAGISVPQSLLAQVDQVVE